MRELFKKIVPGGQFSAEEENRLRDTVSSLDRPVGMGGLIRGPRLIQGLGGTQVYDDTYKPFWAKITGQVTDANQNTAYTWQEQRQDTAGEPTDHLDGRNDNSGSILAYEWSGVEVPTGAYVQLWLGYDSQTYYVFAYTSLEVRDTIQNNLVTPITCTLNGNINASQMKMAVNNVDQFLNFPTDNQFKVTIDKETLLIGVIGEGGTNLTWTIIERGADNTTPTQHLTGAVITWKLGDTAYPISLLTHQQTAFVFPGATGEGIILSEVEFIDILSGPISDPVTGLPIYNGNLMVLDVGSGTWNNMGPVWYTDANNP